MSETFWSIGEIIVGIALLGLLSAVVTAVMVPFLNKLSKRSGAAEILGERYLQMRQDLGIGVSPEDGLHTPQEDGWRCSGPCGGFRSMTPCGSISPASVSW